MPSYCHRCLVPVNDASSPRCPACDTVARSSGWPTDARLGAVVAGGQYRVVRRLGRGGFGTVYLVETVVGGLRRAMKVLHPELASDAAIRARLVQEALVLERVNHPNVARCYAVGTLDDQQALYLLLELVEGRPLSDEIHGPGGTPRALDPLRAVRLAKQIASGLVAVHESGALHRDLKPQNILLVRAGAPDEQVKLVDFGLARVLEDSTASTHQLVGTPAFMAPEQLRHDQAVDVRTDLWQLGAVLHAALTGQPPYDIDPAELLRVVSQHAAHLASGPRPSVRRPDLQALEALDAYASRLLATDRAVRPRSAAIVCAELARLEHSLTPQQSSGTLALLDALCATPGDGAWWALVQYLSGASEEAASLAHDAEARLESWPDALRRAPLCWWDAAREAASPLWPLARALDLSGRGLTDEDARQLAATPALASITQIDLSDNALTDEGLGAIARSPHLHHLRHLSAARNRLTSAAVQHLAESGMLGRLELVDLSGNGVGVRGAELVAAHATQLRVLDLAGNAIGPAGAAAVATSHALHALRELRLGGNAIGSDGVAALATSRTLDAVDTLDLSTNGIGAGGAAALAVATIGPRLQSLDLRGNVLGPAALDVLLSSNRFANLRHLNVAGNALGATGAMLLASTSFARRLKHLDVSDNALGDAGLAALLGGQPLAGLSDLRVARNDITGAAIALLGSAPAELDTLDLSGNPLEGDGLQALAVAIGRLHIRHLVLADVSGAHLPLGALIAACHGSLRSLDVSGTHLTDVGLVDAATTPHMRCLEALSVSRTDVTLSGLRGLAVSGGASSLTTLEIDGLRLGDAAADGLAQSIQAFPALQALSMEDNGLGPRAARALASSTLSHRLCSLTLAHNRLADDGAASLARGAWHVLRELDLEQNDLGAAGIASVAMAPVMPMLCRLEALHNVAFGGVDMHMLSAHVVARIEASFARLSAEGADFASRFYAAFFRRHPGVVPLFRTTSMRRQHQHLMAVLAFLVDNLRHPDTVAASLHDLARRHVGYGVSPSHYYAMSAVLLDAIAETLGDEWTPDIEAAWHEGLTAVITVMLASHRADGPPLEPRPETASAPEALVTH